MEHEKVDCKMAIELAINALNSNGIKYIPDTLDAVYMEKYRFSDGNKEGWLISAKLNVPESFEPNMVFIEISVPNGTVYIPAIL
ncbi:hypothetical protein [Xenorhabdus sp. PB62.4]|uniref:hypothetical protein n=1 Tax=Xenorhabdus sp. PB62.4 TaxID=1851573 RepID=UPI002102551D|nr:hypothetical protein [Xenorhabdus sp. PB62.4]MBC8955024.1 hypothetical protein [Xenorhabdus sp. PB62.4]